MVVEIRKWLVLAAIGCCFAMESVLSAAESEPKPVYDRAKAQELLNKIAPTNTELWLNFELPKSAAPSNEFIGEMPYPEVRLTWEDFAVMTQRLSRATALAQLTLRAHASGRMPIMNLEFLSGATNLAQLTLSDFPVKSLRPLAHGRLADLELEHSKVQDIASVALLTNLTSFAMDDLEEATLRGIRFPCGVSSLSLRKRGKPPLSALEGVLALGKLSRLEELKVGIEDLFEIWCRSEPQKTFPSVKSLTVIPEPSYCGFEWMEEIAARFPALESLCIEAGNEYLGGQYILFLNDVSPLGKLPLKRLSISGSWLRRIQGLDKCPLESLELSNCPLSSVKNICKLPRLRRLVLYDTGVTRTTKKEVLPRFPMLESMEWNDADGESHCHSIGRPSTNMPDGVECVMAAEQAKTRIVLLRPTEWDPEWEGAPNPPEDYGIFWEWRPADDPGIAKADLPRFQNPDECKGRDGGRTILMTASGGAFAAIDVDARKVRCYGIVGGNPHSIEVLPDGRYVIASSEGNALTVVDVAGHLFEPAKQVKKVFPFVQAHGVHWDAKRKVLWAIGGNEIAKFAYDASAMKLSKLKSFPLSTVKMSDGHDLVEGEGCAYSGPFGKDCLAFTAHEGYGCFNLVTEKFEKDVVRCPNVKSLSYKDVCVVRVVPKECWWTDTIGTRWGCETCDCVIKGAKFYKARFLVRKPQNPAKSQKMDDERRNHKTFDGGEGREK